MFACEGNEDMVGRVARLSRRVHQTRVCERILLLYQTKAYALSKKFKKELSRKRPRPSD